MTIATAMDRIQRIKPNHYTPRDMVEWLDQLEGRVWREIVLAHRREPGTAFSGYDQDTSPDTELLVKPPYDEIYIHWLACMIDQGNMELGKYENDRILFNNVWNDYSNWYTRTHVPIGAVEEFRL